MLFKLSRGYVSQVGMKTVAVIKHFNVLNDIPVSYVAGRVEIMVSQFGFQAAESSLFLQSIDH